MEGRPFTSETPPAFRDVMATATAAAADSPSMMSYVSYEEARKQPDQRPTGKIVVDEGRRTFMDSPLRSNVVDHVSSHLQSDGSRKSHLVAVAILKAQSQ